MNPETAVGPDLGSADATAGGSAWNPGAVAAGPASGQKTDAGPVTPNQNGERVNAPLQLFDALPAHIEDALRASIQRFGVLVPVARDQDGRIIDGHHRSRIADQLGVKYRVDVIRVANDEEAREIARTLNSDRRHLSDEQRMAVAVQMREEGRSLNQIGEALAHAAGRYDKPVHPQQVRRLLDKAAAFTTVKAPDRIVGKDGKPQPARRPTVVTAKDPREADRAQDALAIVGDDAPGKVLDVKRIERIARETAAEIRRQEPTDAVTVTGTVDIRHGDFREVLDDVESGSVDAVITDPPYPGEFVCLFFDLSKLAARLLKPNGVLAVMCGQYYLPQYIEALSESMRYRWCGAYIAQGPRTRVHAAKVGTGWKPILLFQQHDADDLPFLLDDLFDSAGDDKRHHHWGQSESGTGALVQRLTAPGALVVDPFIGGGTTAVVCRDLGRPFIGCDIDAAHVATSRERVA